jgi:hypothetical protein
MRDFTTVVVVLSRLRGETRAIPARPEDQLGMRQQSRSKVTRRIPPTVCVGAAQAKETAARADGELVALQTRKRFAATRCGVKS